MACDPSRMTTILPVPRISDHASRAAVSYSIHHQVSFSYGGMVRKNRNQVRLCPPSDERQRCESFLLQIDPETDAREDSDQFGNRVHCFEIKTSHRFLTLKVRSKVSLEEP